MGARCYFRAGQVTLRVVAVGAPPAAKALYLRSAISTRSMAAQSLACLSADAVHGAPAGEAVCVPGASAASMPTIPGAIRSASSTRARSTRAEQWLKIIGGLGSGPAAAMRRTMSSTPKRSRSRSAARLAAVQALYQREMESTPLATLLHEFHHHRLGATIDGVEYAESEVAFFDDIVRGPDARPEELDGLIAANPPRAGRWPGSTSR